MSKTVRELFEEGHRKVVCVDGGFVGTWWTVGEVYTIDDCGLITDDDGNYHEYPAARFEPYTGPDLDKLATAVAEKVIAMIKERL